MAIQWSRSVWVAAASLAALWATVAASAETAAGDAEVVTNSIGMKLRLIQPGSFTMGTEEQTDEMPVHKVTITKPFYIGVTEVTQAQYEKVMGTNPSKHKGANLPVEQVVWSDAQAFCKKLTDMEKKGTCRLPTEAEWEYACRAETKTAYYWGAKPDIKCAWFRANSKDKSHEVGTLKPNAWGLYDMSGNVWEWTGTIYTDTYTGAKEMDPTGPATGAEYVVRGGSWFTHATSLRCSNRRGCLPTRVDGDLGFRVVYVPE